MDYATGIEAQPGHLAMRVMIVNFAAIHTTVIVGPLNYSAGFLILDIYSCLVLSRLLPRVCGPITRRSRDYH